MISSCSTCFSLWSVRSSCVEQTTAGCFKPDHTLSQKFDFRFRWPVLDRARFLGVVCASTKKKLKKKNSELGLWANLARSEWRSVHKEPRKTRKHRFPECFLGAQTCGKQCFLARQTKKPFTENRLAHAHFRKYSLCDHRIQSTLFPRRANGETFVAETNVSEKNRKHFLFLGSKKCFVRAQTGKHLGEHVSSTMFPRLRGPFGSG